MGAPNYPVIRFDIEGIKSSVMHVFGVHNNEFSQLIQDTIEKTITMEWVEKSVQTAVDDCIKESINQITSNYELKRAITSVITDTISVAITQRPTPPGPE